MALVVSLFAVSLQVRAQPDWKHWREPLCLALLVLLLTRAAVAAIARYGLGLPWGVAIVPAASIAPIDLVLASSVRVSAPENASPPASDPMRFDPTAKGGINDGLARLFMLFGPGVLDVYALGAYGWHWLLVDAIWLVLAGCIVGRRCGQAVGR